MVSPSQKRVVVQYLGTAYPMSERRTCRTVRYARASYRYRSHRNPRIKLRQRIREMAQARVRYGYRKIRILLNGEGWGVGKHLAYCLYREEGLTAAASAATAAQSDRAPLAPTSRHPLQ